MPYQHRYIQYARWHGCSPEQQKKQDEASFHEYIIWVNCRWSDYWRSRGESIRRASLADHDDFDQWLAQWVDANGNQEAIEAQIAMKL